MAKTPRPAVPEPQATLPALVATTKALKESVEIMQGPRAGMENAVVRWQDLVDLGLIDKGQIPPR